MQKFKVRWKKGAVKQLLKKVERCEIPDIGAGFGWQLGCERGFLQQLKDYWLHDYDWQQAVDTLNRYRQFTSTIDGLDIHFVHVVGEARGRRPLLITHGWPGSHFEFWQLIEPLAYPSRFGGRAEDAFDLVIPSLPGFGFSGKPAAPISQRETAPLWNQLMTQTLGYDRYLVQGGDFGSIVSSWLAMDFPANVKALHLNMLPLRSMAPPQNEQEGAWMQHAQQQQMQYGAYSMVHMTKPLSIIWASADNPLGQAAWIIERFHDWSDLSTRSFSEVYSLDELITHLMIYLMTDSFGSAVMYYPGIIKDGFCLLPEAAPRVEVPTAYAAFAHDPVLPCPPRSRAELTYNIARWTTPPAGGHFAAMEQPQWLIADLQDWARQYD